MSYEQWKKTVSTPQPYAMYNAATVCKLVDRIEQLEAENAKLKKDQERMEWIRKHIDSAYTRENIDKAIEAIDEAMKNE